MNTKNTSEQSVKCEHTPIDWRIGDAGWTIFGPPNGKPSPTVIATMEQGASMGPLERKANAQFICKAVNCHNDLLEACKVILSHLAPPDANGAQCKLYSDTLHPTDDDKTIVDYLKSTINRALK